MTLIDKAEALAPCPFCGGEARISTRTDECLWSHDQVEWTAISCSGGPDFDCFQPSVDWPSSATDEAGTQLSVSQWNRRAALPARGVPEAMRQMIVQAVAFANRAAGEGICIDDLEPETFLFNYSQATGDEDWDTLPSRILAALAPTDAAQAREAALMEAVAKLRAAPVSGDTAIALGNAHAIAVLEAMIGETPPDPQQAREAALSVLSGLSSYLGTGLGDDDTTAEQFDKRIRWAIDDLTARTRQAALREAAALCDGEERSGGTGWECRDAILALIGEERT